MVPTPQRDFEVIVLGGGPAGLSAGLVLGRCLRQTLICDDGRYRNRRSEALHCFIGHDGVAPADLRQRARHELERYDTVRITARTARNVRRHGNAFSVEFADHARVSASALLVATGVIDELPALEGIEALFGRSVHVCPYCDGWENRNAPVAVYGRGEKGANFASLLRQWTNDLVLCSDGETLEPDLTAKLAARGVGVNIKPIRRLEGVDGRLAAIVFADGERLGRQGLFFTTGQQPRSPLLEALGCTYDEKRGLIRDPDGRTSIAGVYVAGDVSRDVQLAVIAAAEGARAALAINKYLHEASMASRNHGSGSAV
jgi:thioredoxin reductase